MHTTKIQKRVDALAETMLAKGMRSPGATVMMKAAGEPCLHLCWADARQKYGESYDTFHAPTLAEAFAKAEDFVVSRPSPKQMRFDEFMGALGKVIDLGKENDIEVEFLNPLVATMKQLSENALTDQRAA